MFVMGRVVVMRVVPMFIMGVVVVAFVVVFAPLCSCWSSPKLLEVFAKSYPLKKFTKPTID